MQSNGGEMETLVPPRVSDLERRADIDTSAPFESVREAVDRFGGSAQWKSQLRQLFPSQNHYAVANDDARILKEQAARLEIDLARKRKENFDILKELEMTKKIVDSLKLKILNETNDSSDMSEMKIHPISETEHLENPGTLITKIAEEKALLEKTCKNLSTNTALVSFLRKELHDAKSVDLSEEIQKLSSEIEKYQKMKENSEPAILKLNSEIEEMKASLKTAESRFVNAKKMEEAAKATGELITLSVEEYNELRRKAKEAEDSSRRKIEEAMDEVEHAYESKNQLLKNAEKAEAEIRSSRASLEEALIRVEKADSEKLAVEAALRKWRSEQVQKRRYIQSSPKFKNSSHHYRRESKNIDLNKRTLSIGQILSLKLLGPEDYDDAGVVDEKSGEEDVTPRISLGQILSKKQGALWPGNVDAKAFVAGKSYSMKRKKFGFAGVSLLKAKQSKKAKED